MATVSASIKIFDGFTAPLNKLSAGLSKGQSGFNRFKSALSDSGAFDSLTKSASQAGGLFKSVLGGTVIGTGITKGIGLATSGIQSMMGELNEASTSWQTFEGNMNMLGNSPAQIAAAKKSMQKFAQDTIYSASDMSQTYAQLAAVGTKNTEKLVKGFGGLASASENPQQAMKTLSQQATQAAAKPMIQWQDFKLMLEQTPAGMAAVAKTMGMSTKDLVTKVQDGNVATKDFFDAIAKTGTNANFTKMATQYKTIGQAADGLKETLANNLQPAFDRISKVGIKWVSDLTDNVGKVDFSSMADKALNAIDVVTKASGKIFDGFKNTRAISSVQNMFGVLKDSASQVFSKLSGKGKSPFESLGNIAGGAIKGAADSISTIADAVAKLNPGTIKAIGTAFLIMKTGLRGIVFAGLIAGLNALSKMDAGQIKAVAVSVGILAVSIKAIKTAMGVAKGIKAFKDAFAGLKQPKVPKTPELPQTPKTGGIVQSAGAYLKLGAALMLVGVGIALAGGGMMLMAMATTKIASAGGPAIAVFFGMFAAITLLLVVVKLLGPTLIAGAAGFAIFAGALLLISVAVFIASAGIALLATQLPLISIYGVSAAGGLLALAGAITLFGLAAVVGAVGVIALGIAIAILGVGFVVGAVGAVLFGAALLVIGVGAMIAAVGTLLLGTGLIVVATMSILASVGLLLMAVAFVMIAAVVIVAGVGMMIFAVALMIAAPLMMIAAVGALLLGVAATVLGVGLLIVGAALVVVANGLTMVSAAVISLATAFITAGTMMVSAIVGAMSAVVNAVSSGIQNAVNAAKSFASALVSVGKDLIQGLVNGIKSMIGSAVNAVKSVAGKVVGAAKSVLHIGSPSKLFNQYGRWVDQGLINGLNRDSGNAASASANMAQGVVDAASNMNPQLGPMTMSGLENNPGDMLAGGFQRALDVLNSLMSTFQGLNGSNLGVNSTFHSDSNNGDDSNIGNGGLGFGSSVISGGDTSNSQSSVLFESGSIQIQSTGNEEYDAESLVAKIENYLVNRNDASLS